MSENRCHRSSEGVSSAAGVAAEARGAPIWEISDRGTRRNENSPWPLLRRSIDRNGEDQLFGISARTGVGLSPLLLAIERRLEQNRELIHCELPLNAGQVVAWLRRSGKVVEEAYSETAISVTALVSNKIAGQLRKRLAATRSE